MNGLAYAGVGDGLHTAAAEFDVQPPPSAATRSQSRQSTASSHRPPSATSSFTQPLEAKTGLTPDVANTLEHIVGQLDILTQVQQPWCNGATVKPL